MAQVPTLAGQPSSRKKRIKVDQDRVKSSKTLDSAQDAADFVRVCDGIDAETSRAQQSHLALFTTGTTCPKAALILINSPVSNIIDKICAYRVYVIFITCSKERFRAVDGERSLHWMRAVRARRPCMLSFSSGFNTVVVLGGESTLQSVGVVGGDNESSHPDYHRTLML